MSSDTAGSSASVTYVTSTSTSQPSTVAPGLGARDVVTSVRVSTDSRAETPAFGIPRPPPAPWLADVQRRLNGSIGVRGSDALQDGTGLRREIVSVANTFFEATSDLLPAEPYLYSSQIGDLVAEFSAPLGRMTMIISTDFACARGRRWPGHSEDVAPDA
jgi:hypothetical protein